MRWRGCLGSAAPPAPPALRALERASGNRTRAARDLGITRQGLARVLRRVGIR